MKQKKISLRFRAIACLAAAAALFLTLLTGCGPKPLTTVIAASDFQPYHSTKDDPEQGQLYLQTILLQMKKDGYDGYITIEREISGEKQVQDIIIARDIILNA